MDRVHDIKLIESLLRNPNLPDDQIKRLKHQLDVIKMNLAKLNL